MSTKATIVNNVENTTKVIDLADAVTDVAALKHVLDISDGRIFEGTTHTDLKNDYDSLPTLPENKKERGYVFFISPAQNKTRNGAYNRKECYSLIKEKHLENKVKETYGRNFTQVATDALNKILSENGVGGAEPVGTPTPAPTITEAPSSDENVTEKDVFLAIAGAITDEAKKADVLKKIEAVFYNPYSVQDLANMNEQ